MSNVLSNTARPVWYDAMFRLQDENTLSAASREMQKHGNLANALDHIEKEHNAHTR